MRELIEKLSQILPILLIFFVFYVFIMRPQQKKAREHQEMLKHLKRGDTVVMTGGLMGTIDRLLDETRVSLCISEGICVTVMRSAISEILRDGPVIKLDVPDLKKASSEKTPKKLSSKDKK